MATRHEPTNQRRVQLSVALDEIRTAAKEGRLSAQRYVGVLFEGCKYRDDQGNPCAIGVLMDDDLAHDADHSGCLEDDASPAVSDILSDGYLVLLNEDGEPYDSSDEALGLIEQIQAHHDVWCKTGTAREETARDLEDRRKGYKGFCKLLGLNQAEVPFEHQRK